jgi:peptidoglycan/xylan/chitin deacetylase (PgdA/CDA1 family)
MMASLDVVGDTTLRKPPATIHVDLDGAADIYEGHGWRYPFPDDPVFESGLRNFLNLCEETGIRATLFVIARSLDDPRKRALVEEAVRRGHEISSHSLTHKYLPDLDTAGKRYEIQQSREVLEKTLGVPVRGFRAPGYRIDRESLELLARCGYDYDASAFPTAAFAKSLRSTVERLSAAHRPIDGSEFVEWSMPDHRPSPIPFNPSYSLLLGNWYFDWALTRFRRNGTPLVLLFHLIDVADPLPPARLRGLASRIYTLSTLSSARKLRRCRAMLDLVGRHYRILTTTDAIAEWRRTQPPARAADEEATIDVR